MHYSRFQTNLRHFKHVSLKWLKVGLIAILMVLLSLPCLESPAWAAKRVSRLPSGNAITDPRAILRYALPIDNKPVRDLQTSLEDVTNQLRGKRWSLVNKDVSKAGSILRDRQTQILASVVEGKQPIAQSILGEIENNFPNLQSAVEAKDKEAIWTERGKILDLVGQLEATMVPKFPFEVPAEYKNLPQLKGRATIEMVTSLGDINIVVDGYNAPVNAGNFVDLVQRGFYDGLPFIRSEESYVLQTGDPIGPAVGFTDPQTGNYRAIPLEVMVEGDSEPTYGITLEDAGRYQDHPVLPFSSYGAVALARPADDPNGGSSQFFFFLFEPELTPAGFNVLDGRYSVFGYVTQGKEILGELKEGDKIQSAKVLQGLENLVQPPVA